MSKQTIVAFSGRKNAGKNTVAAFVRQYYATNKAAKEFPDPRDTWRITERSDEIEEQDTLECSFADNLKEFCIDTLGLTREQCYGPDEEKNSPTEYEWETAPRFLAWKFADEFGQRMVAEGKTQDELMDIFHRRLFEPVTGGHQNMTYMDGKMTGREIMQMVGTDLNRQTFGNIWAAATIRRIKKKGKALSLITDNRFPNEIKSVLGEPHGFIIRLTRSPFGTVDAHPSESALDGFDWNRDKCFMLDNAAMTIDEQNEAVKPLIDKICHFAGEK